MKRDEVAIEEAHIRSELVRFDAAFCAAMLKAIEGGEEHPRIGVCSEPGTKKPILVPPYEKSRPACS